jgi:uncharacterized protein
MVHAYTNNGYNIVLDVNSGSVHVVDDVVLDLVPIVEEKLVSYHGTAAAPQGEDREGDEDFQKLFNEIILMPEITDKYSPEDIGIHRTEHNPVQWSVPVRDRSVHQSLSTD